MFENEKIRILIDFIDLGVELIILFKNVFSYVVMELELKVDM